MTIVGMVLSLPLDLWAASVVWVRHTLLRCEARLGIKAGPAASDERVAPAADLCEGLCGRVTETVEVHHGRACARCKGLRSEAA